MTEIAFKKWDGKRVRFKKCAFKYSLAREEYEGTIEIVPEKLTLWRNGAYRNYDHIGFYLHRDEGKSIYFDYSQIKLIFFIEELKS